MINWNAIDTVLLDMDGTLLDLHFDNYFWQHYLPRRYAEHHQIEEQQAITELYQRFEEKRATIDWYCTDYWSAQLAVDIAQLKREVRHLIAIRPNVIEFLNYVGQYVGKRVLITNAHRHSLNLKLEVTSLDTHLDTLISAHDYGVPKEHDQFWHQLQAQIGFDPARTVFIDDTESMLHAANHYGIQHLYCISQPDSTMAPRRDLAFPAIDKFTQLLPSVRIQPRG